MVNPNLDPLINLPAGGGSGGATGSFDVPVPTGGGGGMATNYGNSSPVSSYDQWLHAQLFVGWGDKKAVKDRPFGGGGRAVEETGSHAARFPTYKTPFEMLQAFDAFSTAEYNKFKNKLVAAGFVSSQADAVSVRDAYQSILKDMLGTQGQGVNVTPFQFINSLIQKNGFDPKKVPAKAGWDPTASGSSAGAGFTPSTQTATSVYDLDPASAELMLTNMLQQKLGRDPSRAEIEDFVDAVKTRAAQDPTTTTIKTRRGDLSGRADGNTDVEVTQQDGKSYSQVSTTDPGFSADSMALLAQKRAENTPDYRSYQAVAYYYPALEQALGATI